MEATIQSIKHIASTSDGADRVKIRNALWEAYHSLDTPNDILGRISALSPQLSLTRIGVDCGIFKALANSDSPLKTEVIAETCSVDPELAGRILRYLATIHLLRETGRDEFAANLATRVLSGENEESVVHFAFGSLNRVFQELPDYLAETKYQNPSDPTKTPFQIAFKTVLHAFEWLPRDPERHAHGHRSMMAQRQENWFSTFPVEKEVGDWSAEPDKALFVDIGGGGGHQCFRFKAKYPNLPGRIILQDLPATIARFKPGDGVEAMVHSFYDPQPIKGAKFYYLRNIIHDYPDERCLRIIENLIPALDKDSRILFDDIVLSNTGVHWRGASQDMILMTCFAAVERTRDQWYALLDRAGLKILDIHTYDAEVESSVIVAVPK
ncbi:hypothetical protein FQN54_005258 [Arachnomyces sp. PD_36]|nr:hypothetical protein FQN54_005258 [Arachnomyces sp. PD_36]